MLLGANPCSSCGLGPGARSRLRRKALGEKGGLKNFLEEQSYRSR